MSSNLKIETLSARRLAQWFVTPHPGKAIDIATCEITWTYGQILDPYGVRYPLPPEHQQVGRLVFVRSPESGIPETWPFGEEEESRSLVKVAPTIPDVRNSRRRNTSDLCFIKPGFGTPRLLLADASKH
jgi:hypothetical protein